MKHTVSLILVLCMLFFALTSCGTSSTPAEAQPPHTHSFGDWVITKAATCTESGKQERTCSCGEKETLSIEPSGHSTRQGVCSFCQQFINELPNEVEYLSDAVHLVDLSASMISANVDIIISKGPYEKAMEYYNNYFVKYLDEIDSTLNNYPNDFSEFRTKINEMRKEISALTVNLKGSAYDDSKILSEVVKIFVEYRPELNRILGAYKYIL